jgi:hypothetical protein
MNPLRQPYRFGFSIVDDTDSARLEAVLPVYDLLTRLDLRTTKTVWPLRCGGPGNPGSEAHTLEDASYAEWVRALSKEGFEIATHGASAGSNPRAKTIRGLDRFEQFLGYLPSLHINHGQNQDNVYWGVARFDSPVIRAAVRCAKGKSRRSFVGHRPGSGYFWGGLCQQHIRYSRNLTFSGLISLRAVNPTIPYRDDRRPFVRAWFSACNAASPRQFVGLLSAGNLERLQDEQGICILHTHFGEGFARGGEVSSPVASALERVARLPGRFVPVTQLLDESRGPDRDAEAPRLPTSERMRMEYTWLKQRLAERRTS